MGNQFRNRRVAGHPPRFIPLKSLFLAAALSLPAGNAGAQTGAATGWPRFQGGPQATGQARVTGPQSAQLKWKVGVGGWSGSPAVAPDGTVYFCASPGGLIALDPAGRERWRFRLPPSSAPPNLGAEEAEEWVDLKNGGSSATHAPAIARDGTIYFGVTFHPHETPKDAKLGLYALSPQGKLKWFFPTQSAVISSPNLYPDGSVVFTTTKKLYRVATDGSEKWSVPTKNRSVKWSSPALDAQGNVYLVDTTLRSYTPDGSLRWSYAPATPIKGFAAHPVIGPGNAVYFAAGPKLYAVDSKGKESWVVSLGHTEAAPALASNGTLYVGTGRTENSKAAFHGVSAADGTIRFSMPIKNAVDSSAIIGKDGTVYFGTDDGDFYALSPSGKVKWKMDIGRKKGAFRYDGEVDTAAALATDGTLYFAHAGGMGEGFHLYFYAVKP